MTDGSKNETAGKPGLLLMSSNWESFLDGALDDRFEIVRLWQAEDSQELLAERGHEIVATLTTRMDASLLDKLANLRLIAVPGAGYENVPVEAARKRGITIANAGDTHSADVADHAVALTLSAIHHLPDMQAHVSSGAWRAGRSIGRRHAMSAQRFGIVGLGNIGTAIANRLDAFGGEIAWWGPRDKPASWPRRESLADLARWSTVLIVATRGDTDGLIDADVIDAVGSQGTIVNIARGSVIDEDALIAALTAGRLGGAALDVFAEEPTPSDRWRDVPNVILTPHVAGVSDESMTHLREAAIRNLSTVLDGGAVVNEIG
ncbi:NAD(P)-dependent oxidoreductase [Pararhizobium mangrovi]|uniref:2-hydroxyacid dehydrogenase n=1 Tax=Pararhizobium mangrovi TaxID=2590452 RepID=A0A506U372_9HYPH|nr:NAD(P)-dependent oxidoreductase [Pararhizobium mangrovi]TPW27721.1 2-hydroxyacid dehydrogenase [Pararhizobium mangrovi]